MSDNEDIHDFEYLWTTEKGRWVLVRDEEGYSIVDQKDSMMLLVEDDALAEAVAARMLEEGCRVYDDIREALHKG